MGSGRLQQACPKPAGDSPHVHAWVSLHIFMIQTLACMHDLACTVIQLAHDRTLPGCCASCVLAGAPVAPSEREQQRQRLPILAWPHLHSHCGPSAHAEMTTAPENQQRAFLLGIARVLFWKGNGLAVACGQACGPNNSTRHVINFPKRHTVHLNFKLTRASHSGYCVMDKSAHCGSSQAYTWAMEVTDLEI